MKAIVTTLLAAAALTATQGMAQVRQQPISRVTFDCVPGPGYMRISVMDPWLNRQTKVIWVGADTEGDAFCSDQQENLRATRGTVAMPTLFGVCYGYADTDVWYLRRYAVNAFGAFAFQGDVGQASRAACLTAAQATNAN